MPKSMVIVESPAKARTIEKYLGKDYTVKACGGHIKDLPKGALGVNIRQDFTPTYRIIPGKEKIVRELKRTAENSKAIYLAADLDREGEAICQHLAEELNGGQTSRPVHRVLFNEITPGAILRAFEHPLAIDRNKVDAQQARRILDRLVGYKVSPLLWQKVRRGLSAGRVQSVALRMIVDREREIRVFVPEEYWNFTARLGAQSPPVFEAKAVKLDGKKFKISNQAEADELLAHLQEVEFRVADVKKREKRQSPVPPFITSKLQQEAARKLRFSVKKTMTIAQRLYEGVGIGEEGPVGLITYMRTDSTRVAQSALEEVRSYVETGFGKDYLPAKPVLYKGRKSAQDAHEAIRPTAVVRDPQRVKPYLNRDEFRLYELIWKRFVASQMNPALFDQTDISIQAGRVEFKAVGSILRFDGFLKVYRETPEETPQTEPEGEQGRVPEVKAGEVLRVEKVVPEQKFTQPPPRYTEATLVKALEEKGIGRPSTYAQILSVIQDRHYVNKDEGRFVPTEIGEVVIDLLVDYFQEIFNYDYTARLEEELDEIESGRERWIHTLREFYTEFSKELQHAHKKMKNLKKEEPAGIDCEKCGSPMVIRWGKFGRFIACSTYPECKNTREIPREDSVADAGPETLQEETCESCGRPMVLRRGRYGEFLACSGYPDCKSTKRLVQGQGGTRVTEDRPLEESCPSCGSQLVRRHGRFGEFVACSGYPKCDYVKQESTGVTCPSCTSGQVVKKRSRRGKTFYGCNRYPECEFVLWYKPVARPCPQCGASYLLERSARKEGLIYACADRKCGYREAAAEVQPAATGSS